MLFASLSNIPRKTMFILGFLIALGFLVFGIDFLLAPKKAKDVSLPFFSGQCLYYENTAASRDEVVDEKKCFTTLEDGKFKEEDRFGNTDKGTVITYDKKGFTMLTEVNDPMFKSVFRSTNVIEKDMIAKTKLRNTLYAQPNLEPGTIFYDGYPVKEWTDYNGKPTYVVEWNPHYDLFLVEKGPLLRKFFELSYKYNKIAYKYKQNPKQAHEATVTRFYYNRSTGVLEGRERGLIKYDNSWNEIAGGLVLEEKSVLVDDGA